jgi:D-glycero-D-manno-heptose 1,7-bisphosphate phosphatase
LLNKAVFLDRDGVINEPIIKEGRSYPPKNLDEFKILPNVDKALQLLKKANYLLIVITNQPDVGDGKQKKEIVESFHEFLLANLPIDDIFVCYDRNSFCYKPKPGLLLRAIEKYNIDCKLSYMIGDRWRDIEAGKSVGCQTFFIDWKYKESLKSEPKEIVSSLFEGAEKIVEIKY